MDNLYPAIGASGIYTLSSPFETRPATSYSCKAVRSFDDLLRMGDDVFKLYYEPYGLTESDYITDYNNKVALVTIIADEIGLELSPSDPKTLIYVPSSYIISFPDGNNVPYSIIVLSASLGALPDYLDLSNVLSDVGDIISEKIGVVPEVKIHKALSSGIITSEQHLIAETGRQSAITNRTTPQSLYNELNNTFNEMQIQYTALESSYIAINDNNDDFNDILDRMGYFTIDLTNTVADETIYFDNNQFNKIKLTIDPSSVPIGSYFSVNGSNVNNGVTVTPNGNIDILFEVNKLNITADDVTFTLDLYDNNDIQFDDFNVKIIFIDRGLNTPFSSVLSIPVDLTVSNQLRVYFNNLRKTKHLVWNHSPIVDDFDPMEVYYKSTGTATGITFTYGKNYLDITVDDSLYPPSTSESVPLSFLLRELDMEGNPTDITSTVTLNISNNP